MSENDFDRTARLWLDDGPSELSDRVLQAALDEIHITEQRRSWWPARRFRQMSTPIRIAMAAAAVVLFALVGVNFTASRGGVGGPAPTPTATPAPTPVPTPTPALTVPQGTASQPLQPGTYVVADPFLVPVTFTVPAGWQGHVGGAYYLELSRLDGTGQIGFGLSLALYADPCHANSGLLSPQPGPSATDLATALAQLPGLQVSAPTDASLGGYQGKQLTLTAPSTGTGCASGVPYGVMQLPLGGSYDLNPGDSFHVWILDVDGQRLVIDGPVQPDAEVQGVLDSVRITPTPTSPSPSASPSGS